MIARQGYSINAGEGDAPPPVLPSVPGLDVAVSAQRVAEWGGDRVRYLRALGRALAAMPALGADPSAFADAAAVAGWRAGALGLRADALRRIGLALDAGDGRRATAMTAALGLAPVPVAAGESFERAGTLTLAAFAAGQLDDRFFWPGWESGGYVLARLGGFLGLGGPWSAPPSDPERLGPGRWALTVAGQMWWLECDLFGHILAAKPLAFAVETPGSAELAVSPYSYLAIVHSPRTAA